MINDSYYNELLKVPVGPLGIIAMNGSTELADKVNEYLVRWRADFVGTDLNHLAFPGYKRDTYLVNAECPRFSSGEAKGVIRESVRGYDLFILCDILNYSCKYKMFGRENHMSPDDHFQDVKRLISAISGKGRRINVIMPFLYESRQHKRVSRESLDCAIALQELNSLGVDNILTFDAHDPTVQNAIPIKGFENIFPTYQIIKALLHTEKDLIISKDRMQVISPDVGGMGRNLYYANVLGLNIGVFYKRRDYTRIVNGKNPIVAHEFLGDSVEGKDILIVDDMLASGESVLDITKELKRRKANRIYVAVTFALFTEGLDAFNEAFENGYITKLFSTNLTYRSPELLKAPWYVDVDMSKFLAYLIDNLNHDDSLSVLLNPLKKITILLDKYRKGLI